MVFGRKKKRITGRPFVKGGDPRAMNSGKTSVVLEELPLLCRSTGTRDPIPEEQSRGGQKLIETSRLRLFSSTWNCEICDMVFATCSTTKTVNGRANHVAQHFSVIFLVESEEKESSVKGYEGQNYFIRFYHILYPCAL